MILGRPRYSMRNIPYWYQERMGWIDPWGLTVGQAASAMRRLGRGFIALGDAIQSSKEFQEGRIRIPQRVSGRMDNE